MTGVMIQTAILVAAILAVQKIFGKRLHAYLRYGLWLLVVFRLLMPVNLIDSPFSVLRIVQTALMQYEEALHDDIIAEAGRQADSRNDIAKSKDRLQTGNNTQTDKAGQAGGSIQTGKTGQADNNMQTNKADQAGSNIQINKTAQTINNKRLDVIEHLTHIPHIKTILQTVWLMGSLIVGSFFAISHFCFRRRLRRTRTIYQESTQNAAQKKRVPVYFVRGLESPCLVGFFHPGIYIGTDIDAGSDSFRYAVTHEQVHYLHKDHIWAVVRAALVVVYWFHLFVWIAAAASARDGEIACDYGTVKRIGQAERFAYGEMLLTFSHKKEKRIYSYGTMLRPCKSELKERILRLTETKSNRKWAGILTAVFMAVLAGCAFTGVKAGDSENQEQDGTFNIVLKNPAGEESANTGGSLSEDEKNSQDAENNGNSQNAEDIKNSENNEDIGNYENENQSEMITQPLLLETVSADISGETAFGVDGPTLDYAGNLETGNENIIIFHDYFGLIVYDLMNQKIIRSLDLAAIGCHMTQGDDACQTAVSADGTMVWLHPMSKPYKYRYDVEKDLLYQEPLVKTFSIDLEGEDLFDRYIVTEEVTQKYVGWRSNYLYEEYQDERGFHNAYIYLYVLDEEEQKLDNLECVWDDMVFKLQWDTVDDQNNNVDQMSQQEEKDDFPYQYDGISEQVEIIYDKPCDYSRISDTYGSRENPLTQETIMHEGIDFAAKEGTDVLAAADGMVYETGYSTKYGNYVVLLHINGDMTYYCHCQKILVEKDDQVKRGETIATVGSTGMSTGAHLHFALSRDGWFVDPKEHMRVVIALN